MWTEAGKGDVILLAPTQNAANVLREMTGGQYPVYNTAQFLGHLEGERGALGPVAITPGTLLIGDESSVTSMADLRDLAAYAAETGSAFKPIGDDGQLTAPEGGGGLSLMTRSQEHVQLAEPQRFAAEWEADASLRVRAGDVSVLDKYEEQGRIRGGGTLDQTMDEARKAYLAGFIQGKDVLLMAQSNDHAREMSARIRDDLQHLGLVQRGAEASLRDGGKASVGDLIVTRQNDHKLGIANGNAWRVEKIDGETITMRQMLDADKTRANGGSPTTPSHTGSQGRRQPRLRRARAARVHPARRPRLWHHRPHRPGPDRLRLIRCSPAMKTATGRTRG